MYDCDATRLIKTDDSAHSSEDLTQLENDLTHADYMDGPPYTFID